MKKMSLGLYGIGMALLLTSCVVSKKKYEAAQTRISQLEQTNASCVAKTDSLNSNLSALTQRNSDLQSRYDSSLNVYSAQRNTWSSYTGFYDKQKSNAEQMHQGLHSQLDDMIGASNIVLSNNKVYVTLPESTLFTSGSTNLSTKGTEIVNTLAANISQHPDVEVYVATSALDPATGALAANDENVSNDMSTPDNSGAVSNANKNDNYKSAPKTKTTHSTAPAKKAKSSYASTTPATTSKPKSEATHKTMKSNYAKAKKPTSSSSSMAVARASTIVSALRQQGVQKAGIQVTDPVNRGNTSARKYQVIVTPSMEGYYQMMGKGDMGTGMK